MRQTFEEIVEELRRHDDVILQRAVINPPNPGLLERDPFLMSESHQYREYEHQHVLKDFAQADGVAIEWVRRSWARRDGMDTQQAQARHEQRTLDGTIFTQWPDYPTPVHLEEQGLHGCIYIRPLAQILAEGSFFDDYGVVHQGVELAACIEFDWGTYNSMHSFVPMPRSECIGVMRVEDYGRNLCDHTSWQSYLRTIRRTYGSSDGRAFGAR